MRPPGRRSETVNHVGDVPLGILAGRCREETEKFTRREHHDDRFCFELMRRAFAEGVEVAFTHVFQIYEPQVLSWIRRDSRLERTNETAEYFSSQALSNVYFALRGPRFARFPSLQKVLSYLKVAAYSVVTQYLRDHAPPLTQYSPDDEAVTETPALDGEPDERMGAEELWTRICALLPDVDSRLLARCAFVLSMKPREIARAYPGRWESDRSITLALYRIRQVLRADEELRGWL
jgi:hypothetical protein